MLEDVLEILVSTPEKLRRELSALTSRGMKIAPAPGEWSVQLVLAHLDDVEDYGMRRRVEAMIREERPTLAAFDQEARAVELHYDRKDPRRSLESFTRQRRANVKWLRTLKPAQLKRQGVHEKVGEISAQELITEWAFHDLGHLKQILEIKRCALFPRMGNMRAFYKLT